MKCHILVMRYCIRGLHCFAKTKSIFREKNTFCLEIITCDPSIIQWILHSLMKKYEPRHEIYNNVVCATSKPSDQPAHTRSLVRAFASRLNILWIMSYWLNIILEFLSLKGGCTGSSESTLVKMSYCWKSHVAAQLYWSELANINAW